MSFAPVETFPALLCQLGSCKVSLPCEADDDWPLLLKRLSSLCGLASLLQRRLVLFH